MVIFNSYVSLPEGNPHCQSIPPILHVSPSGAGLEMGVAGVGSGCLEND